MQKINICRVNKDTNVPHLIMVKKLRVDADTDTCSVTVTYQGHTYNLEGTIWFPLIDLNSPID